MIGHDALGCRNGARPFNNNEDQRQGRGNKNEPDKKNVIVINHQDKGWQVQRNKSENQAERKTLNVAERSDGLNNKTDQVRRNRSAENFHQDECI